MASDRGGYGNHPMPVGAGPCTLEVINLDYHPVIRVQQGRYLIGYFPTVEAAVAHGVDLATAIIKE